MLRSKNILAAIIVMSLCVRASAYIDLAPTLAKIITDSRQIALVEVESYDPATHELVLKEIKPLKGEASTAPARHDVTGTDGAPVPRPIALWATPGARAITFNGRNTALICLGQGWYQVRAAGDGPWKMGAERPDLPLAYYGSLSRLTESVEAMVAGKDAVLTVVAFGADDEGASFDLALNRQDLPGLARVQRIRANLKMPGTVMGSSSSPAYFIGGGSVDESDVPNLIEKLKSSDPVLRFEAADDLRTLGRKAKAAAQPLSQLLDDSSPRVRLSAATALLRISPDDSRAIDVLSKGLSSSDASLRRQAAKAVGLAKAGSLADKLTGMLSDQDEATQVAALQAISLLGKSASGTVDVVTPLLDKPSLMTDAADALGRIGPAARPALPKLAKMLESEHTPVQWTAVRAMSQIGGPEAYPAVQFMIRALPQATEVEGYNMMIYLSLLGPVAADSIPTVRNTPIKNPVLPTAVQWAVNPEQYFPWQGGQGGGEFGRRGRGPGGPGGGGGGGDIFSLIYQAYVRELGDRLRPAARVLAQKIMDNTAGDVPNWGYDILACGPDDVIAILSPHLTSDDINLRERATVALGYMGPAAAPAKAQLASAMTKSSSEREKRLIQWAIREIEHD